MPSRAHDWLRQAQRDLQHAHRSAGMGDHEWACFAAQQAAEKALKAVLQDRGGEARGHSARALLRLLPPGIGADSDRAALEPDALELDRHYVPARYPNSMPEGAPFEFYDDHQSRSALAAADRIVRFCERHLAGPDGGA
jgi:HEPN domain-containing protein